jgi:acyl-coenzyme A thioesterase PaaI-like protein
LSGFTVKYAENACFMCGQNNPDGFKVQFTLDGDDSVYFRVSIPEKYQGYDGIVHGGLISAILDEAMANCFFRRGIDCLTAELKIRFKKALPVNHEVTVHGRISENDGKIGSANGWVEDYNGVVYAEGEGKFYLIRNNPAVVLKSKKSSSG